MSADTHLPKLSYSIDEACEITGLGRSFIYEELRAGRIKGRKCGRRTLVLKGDLEEYLENLPDRPTNDSKGRAL